MRRTWQDERQDVQEVTHQADEDEDELDDVSVGHRVEASQQGVGDGHRCRDPDAHSVGQVQDHAHGDAFGDAGDTHTHTQSLAY